MRTRIALALMILSVLAIQCTGQTAAHQADEGLRSAESIRAHDTSDTPIEIKIEKEFAYDKHTLEDEYPYLQGTRRFQWDKITDSLRSLERAQQMDDIAWVTLQNYKNKNGVAPLVQDPYKDEYKSDADPYGVSRYQSIPLYDGDDMSKPIRYARDGSLVRFLKDSADYVKVCSMQYDGEWYVPVKYVRTLEAKKFDRVIFVDRTNQNIATLEHSGDKWLVRSMNPATTGLHHPPHQQETPLGTFVIQEKKPKMFYLVDGTSTIAGYAPYASRFTRGGYIHGVPLNNPHATEADYIEFSPTLGTTPRSHMCVRNATSHAQFVYDWAPPFESLVFVIE